MHRHISLHSDSILYVFVKLLEEYGFGLSRKIRTLKFCTITLQEID